MGGITGDAMVKGLREGDIAVFEKIFHFYFPRLSKFADAYLADWEESRNISQEVLLTLWQKKESLAEDSNINGYLLTLTRNHCLNYLKSFHGKVSKSAVLELNYLSLQYMDENLLQYEELEQAVMAAIDSLPEQCRKVFRMSRFENLSHQEIAASLQISQKTVENHISKALSTLRIKLKPYIGILILIMAQKF